MENKQTAETAAADSLQSHFTEEDLAKLYDYPSIGQLFSEPDTRRLDEFCQRLRATRENLERVVRYGDRANSERATRAIRAVEVTLDFLQSLREMRQ
ncbi:MAG TPA: hypothetical protein VF721_02875 [Pyrinomonadaceae bacterium]|jgi:hypothetical protein